MTVNNRSLNGTVGLRMYTRSLEKRIERQERELIALREWKQLAIKVDEKLGKIVDRLRAEAGRE